MPIVTALSASGGGRNDGEKSEPLMQYQGGRLIGIKIHLVTILRIHSADEMTTLGKVLDLSANFLRTLIGG
jgi:hypothetical protein